MAGSWARDVHGVWLEMKVFSMKLQQVLDEPGRKDLLWGEGNLIV